MMRTNQPTSLFKDSFGYDLPITSGLDMRDTRAVKVKLTKPSSQTIEVDLPPANITDRATGTINLPILDGYLSELGQYAVQVIDTTAGRRIMGGIGYFYVQPGL